MALTAGAERSLDFNALHPESWGGGVILLALGIKCAFPGVHFWLKDSYPRASAVGAVFLAPFTTKLAVYGLARAFAGADILIPIGAAMVIFPILYASVENDLRRTLSYSLVNQLGFMVIGIGIGGPAGVGGAVALAFCHVFYKGLLFMGVGAVLERTGTAKASELGGLWRTMPVTAIFTMIGAASISAAPLFSGFIAKSLLLDAATGQALWWVWIVMVIGAAGVLEHAGVKIPADATVTSTVGIGPRSEGGFGLEVSLAVALPGVAREAAESVVARAHAACPYSNATRNNIDVKLGLVMILAMTLNLLLAALMGVMIPMTMLRVGRDPAVGSSVLITAVTDSGGFFIFLGLATVFLL